MDTGHGTTDTRTLPIKPLPGKAILAVLSAREERVGAIWIPEKARGLSWTGRVLAFTPYAPGRRVMIWRAHRRRSVADASGEAAELQVGQTVAISDGVQFSYGGQDLLRARLEHILAIMPDRAELVSADEDVPRCRWCRTAGEGNLILHSDGHCPRCGRDRDGKEKESWKQSALVRS